MQRFNKIFIYLLLLVGTSCEYFPQETYFKTVNEQPLSNVVINFNSAPDTIQMTAPIIMQYSIGGVDASKKYSIDISVTPNPGKVIEVSNLSGSFYILPFDSEGYYTLTMTVNSSSGTGSLADHAGAEQVAFQKSVVIQYVTHWPIVAAPYEGRLRVKWQTYGQADFISYALYVQYRDSTGNSVTKQRRFFNAGSNSFIDSAYVGGAVTYSIIVISRGQNINGSVDYTDSPIITKLQLQNGSVTANWSKSKYYNNFKQYHLFFGSPPYVTRIRKNHINDTVATFAASFGSAMAINLITKSTNGSGLTSKYFLWSDPRPTRYSFFIVPNRNYNRYYTWLYNLNAYDISTGMLTDSILTKYSNNGYPVFAASPSGKNVWVYNDQKFSQVDPTSISISRSISGWDIVTPRNLQVQGFGISDQGTLVVRNYDQIFAYDVNTNSLKTAPYNGPSHSFNDQDRITFSADGQYFATKYYLFRLSANTITQIGGYYDAHAFDELNQEQLLIFDDKQRTFIIKNLTTQEILQQYQASVTFPKFMTYRIDPVTKWLLMTTYTSPEKLIVYDFINDKQIFSAGNATTNPMLYNGTLYSGSGAKIKLKGISIVHSSIKH